MVDLGCGTGEHARHLAAHGFRVLGVDRSQEQIGQAQEFQDESPPYGPRFLEGDFTELERLTDKRFGAAICLGNVIPHLNDEAFQAMLAALSKRLLPGGRLIFQLLNYERIFAEGVRHLPVNVREHPEGEDEIVFLRLLKPDGDRHILFFPTTLRLRPGGEPALAIEAGKEVRLRAWRWGELEPLLAAAGFAVTEICGDMGRSDYDPRVSADLIVTATLE